jgi:hypothetical protein
MHTIIYAGSLINADSLPPLILIALGALALGLAMNVGSYRGLSLLVNTLWFAACAFVIVVSIAYIGAAVMHRIVYH